jgi:small GTP-binding protein
MSYDYLFKVIILGDNGVGKTSLMNKYVDDKSPEAYNPTIGVDFRARIIDNEHNQRIKLHLWDTAGQESFRSIIQSYYRSVGGAIIVYDVTDTRSFSNVRYWIAELRRLNENACPVPILLLGNKIDRGDRRQVTETEAAQFAKDYEILYEEISVLDNINLDGSLMQLWNKISDTFIVEGHLCSGVKSATKIAGKTKDRSYCSVKEARDCCQLY